jgi:hypothetical protein
LAQELPSYAFFCGPGITIAFVVLVMLACSLTQPVPTPEPTSTPTATSVPTATPTVTPTPTVDPWAVYMIPPIEFFNFKIREVHDDFRILPGYGVLRDATVCVGFESPAGSGELYMSVWEIVGNQWVWMDTVPVGEKKEQRFGGETRAY